MVYKPGILLGQITKNSGFEGAVLVKLEKIFIDNIPELESVFLEIDGKPVPFILSLAEYQGADILKMAFEGYDSLKKTEEFRGARVFLTTPQNTTKNAEAGMEILIDYSLVNQNNDVIGSITGVDDNAGQILLTIKPARGSEILIPLHENLIIGIDKKKRIVQMDLPEGLTELNS